jgi:hypothetical protein
MFSITVSQDYNNWICELSIKQFFHQHMNFSSSSSSPFEFIAFLTANNIKYFHFVFQNGHLKASHDVLQTLATELQNVGDDFDKHEGAFYKLSSTGVLMSAVVHRTNRGQAAGGIRNFLYDGFLESFLYNFRYEYILS